MDIVSWPIAFNLVTRTWIVTGCFNVPTKKDSQDDCLICELHEIEEYEFSFIDRIMDLRERSTDFSVIKALTWAEEQFRAKAIELTRSEARIPWSKALVRALAEN